MFDPPVIETWQQPDQEIVAAIDAGLHAYNESVIGQYQLHRIAVVARDEADTIIGGSYGDLLWDWCYVKRLWVHANWRKHGLGSNLLHGIEAAAIEQGFSRFHLETTSFQALEFYQKHGYSLFGVLNDKPVGHKRYYLKKIISLT